MAGDPVSISCGPFRVTRRRYEGGLRQPMHAHEEGQVTILLGGAIRETVGAREEFGAPLAISVKPPGVRHADEVGPAGARTLQIAFPDGALGPYQASVECWRWIQDASLVRAMLPLAAGLGGSATHPGLEDDVWNAIGSIPPREPERRDPGVEMRRVRERIDDDPEGATVATLARAAGLHPGSLTRAFRRAFGVSVVAYRTGRRFRRAAATIAFAGDDLTRVALESGYADHAHLTRDFRRRCGVTPSEYRRITRG